ncbi:MAG: hypothetical protein Q4C52_05330 [Eubacteriales bacterium]|nr:hypothetical protein [Eubacteriales bacterium]
MRKQYQFGRVQIELQMPDGMSMPKNMGMFECEGADADMLFQLEYTSDLMAVERQFRREHVKIQEIRRENMRILIAGNRECRILSFHGNAAPYAVSVEENEKKNHVWVAEEVASLLSHDTIFVSLLSLEKLMIKNNALILHSAYMCREDRAVLFSAPSETGKSTQADLWEKYRQTRTINGDRSLLIREPDGWYAYGWPVCGSSEICHNETYPIHAIVMLHQAEDNEVIRLNGFSIIQRLMAQITINMWNAEFQTRALDLIEQIALEIPVYELGCNISEEAVQCLERVL